MDGHDGGALSDASGDGARFRHANFLVHTSPVLQRDAKRGHIGTLQCNAVGIQWDRLLHYIRSGHEIMARATVDQDSEILYIHLDARNKNFDKDGA